MLQPDRQRRTSRIDPQADLAGVLARTAAIPVSQLDNLPPLPLNRSLHRDRIYLQTAMNQPKYASRWTHRQECNGMWAAA
jgi:hypothetical protein